MTTNKRKGMAGKARIHNLTVETTEDYSSLDSMNPQSDGRGGMVWRKHIFIFMFCLFLIAVIGMWYVSTKVNGYKGLIYPNIYVDDHYAAKQAKQDIEKYYASKNKAIENTLFTVIYKNKPISSFSASLLKVRYNGNEMAEKAYSIGRSPVLTDRIYNILAVFLNLKTISLHSAITFDSAPVREMVSYNEEKFNKPAKNALFKFENGKVVTFREDEKGLEILPDTLLVDFDKQVQSLKNKPQNKTIVLKDKVISPEITLAHSNSYGIEELIAEGKSDYSHSIPERIHNLTLASSKFNGVLIPKGKIFSFNQNVGDISSLTGYKPAYIIKDGKTVLGDGGGVCQVSTTLFRAALNAGLPIIERYPHAYRVSYYENDSKPGFDATVFAPSVDLKFKNDTPAPILIQVEIDKERNLLYFRFYGKKDTRKVKISPVTVYDVQPPPPPLYQDDLTLKKGTVKQVDFPAWGSKVYFMYEVSKENQKPVITRFFSAYKPWRAIFLQGTAD